MAAVKTGIAWYRREDWPLLLSLSTDGGFLERTYDEWLAAAEKTYRDLKVRGADVEKVEVTVAELVAWCRRKQRPMDETARSTFLAAKLRGTADEPETAPKPA